MTKYSPRLDGVFQALADPTRRAVIVRLARGPASTSELARPFRMALPTFTRHMAVLEGSGVVRSRKHGRVRTYALAPAALRTAERWLTEQRALWERRLDQLETYLMTLKETGE